jgi:hypothetical protein
MLWPKTTSWRLTRALRGQGQTLNEIAQEFGVRESVATRFIQSALRRGHIFYIYDTFRLVNDVAVRYLSRCSQEVSFVSIANRLSEIVARFSHTPSPVELSRSIAMLIASCPLGLGELLTLKLRPKLQRPSPNALFDFPLGEESQPMGTLTPDTARHDKANTLSKYRTYLLSEDARNAPRLHPDSMAPYGYFGKEKYIEAHVVAPMREITRRDFAGRFHSGPRVYG